MKTPNLLDVPKDSPTKRERIAAFKKQHGIWTHVDKENKIGGHAWDAMAFDKSVEALSGYNLTEGEKREPVLLIAGYCRLLEEAGLLVTGNTEIDAIRTLCAKNGIQCPL